MRTRVDIFYLQELQTASPAPAGVWYNAAIPAAYSSVIGKTKSLRRWLQTTMKRWFAT